MVVVFNRNIEHIAVQHTVFCLVALGGLVLQMY